MINQMLFSRTVYNFMNCPHFNELPTISRPASISWTAYNVKDCLQHYGLPIISWTTYNFMDCLQLHGLPKISWTANNFMDYL